MHPSCSSVTLITKRLTQKLLTKSANAKGAVANGSAPAMELLEDSATCCSNRGARNHLREKLQKSDGDIIPIAFCMKYQVW